MIKGYTSYFDASGHPDQTTVLTVAGFVSNIEKWSRFDVEWNSILKSEGITRFRMTDFVSSQGEFAAGWTGQTTRRRGFVERLAECLKRNVNKSFRTTLILPDYQTANKNLQIKERLGRPYTLCCMTCVFCLRKWAKKKGAEEKLLYYFEDGDKGKGDFERMHKDAYKVAPKFLDKSEAVGFQAADFAGWKIRSNVQTALKSDHTLEKGIQLLRSVEMLRSIPKDAGVINLETLAKYCNVYKVPRR
jgi:hypothetical protein